MSIWLEMVKRNPSKSWNSALNHPLSYKLADDLVQKHIF